MSAKVELKVIYLIFLVMFLVMFSRVLSALGIPKFIDFAHFLVILICLVLSWIHLKRTTVLLTPIGLLCFAYILSGLWNEAGFVNIVLGFVLVAEPFVLLFFYSIIRWNTKSTSILRNLVLFTIFSHIIFSYFQYFVLELTDDEVKGLFLGMNNGHHVGGALSMVGGIYFAASSFIKNIWYKLVGCLLLFGQIIMADAKQVLLVFIISYFTYLVMFNRSYSIFLKILILVSGYFFVITMIQFVPGFSAWDTSVISEAMGQKFSVFLLQASYFQSYANWILGLGPGHSISRLAWLMSDYINVLEPLGVTFHDATSAIISSNQAHWMSNSITGSSLFSLFFSFAGIWGDVGFLGLMFYIWCWVIVWKIFVVHDSQKLLIISVVVFGIVFAYLEEPGFTLFLCTILALLRYEKLHGAHNQ